MHGDISRVFESAPPQEEEEDEENLIESEDELEMAPHVLHGQSVGEEENENQFERAFGHASDENAKGKENGKESVKDHGHDGAMSPKLIRMITNKSRRDSVIPWAKAGSEIGELGIGIGGDLEKRLDALEKTTARIESLLVRLCDDLSDGGV